MPSLQESDCNVLTEQPTTSTEADYVNTDIINDLIKAESGGDCTEIIQKENVCNIKIKGDEQLLQQQQPKKPKRSASTVSASIKTQIRTSDKASRLLGIDEHVHLDSGRFSMGSSLSPALNQKGMVDTSNNSINSHLKVEDRSKFKSLGDLHMEKGLPTVLVNQ